MPWFLICGHTKNTTLAVTVNFFTLLSVVWLSHIFDGGKKITNKNYNNNWFLHSSFLEGDTTRGALQCIITPGHWIQYQSCTHRAPSQLLGEHSGQAPHQAANNVRILPGTHLYTWMESSNVDNVSCWRTTVPDIDGNETRNHLIQSQGFNPIYHGTST